MYMLGAVSDTQDATEETQRICDQVSDPLPSFSTTSTYDSLVCTWVWICCIFIKVKAKVEDKTNKKYNEFRAVKYKDQYVAGVNFFIKVTNIVKLLKKNKHLRYATLHNY